jgi:selT/selW/selH-like putative selenoprotein
VVLEKELGLRVRLVVGKPGQFDVVADGKLVFSKGSAGRFPDPSEVVAALK